MPSSVAREPELEFERGGPSDRLMQRVGLVVGAGPSIGRRTVALLLITWVPLLVLSLIDGRALGPTPHESFLLDFATYARFFVAVPLLFASEAVVGPRLRSAGLQFVRGDFVPPEDLPAFDAAIGRVSRRREALLPELAMLGLTVLAAGRLEGWTGQAPVATWRTATEWGLAGLSPAGLWYHFVGAPLVTFFALRWLWRRLVWTLFLADMARLPLRLVPTHADRSAGLGFLEMAHLSFGIFAFAFGAVLSGNLASRIYFEGAPIESFKGLVIAYLVVMELICLGPLLMFLPMLARARREGLYRYSRLADTYNRAFEEKWVTGRAPPGERLLGSSDIQSLADLGNSFDMIRAMRLVPFGRQLVVGIAVVACLPGLPLALMVMPVADLLNLLAGALI